MKDLIIISAYCDTEEKEDILRNLVQQVYQNGSFDLLLVSHTPIPIDISKKCTLSLYDSKNELLYDWDLRSRPWFNPGNEREIQSIFTGFFNTHLAIWRMLILGNSMAKNLGYRKVHHIEYDASIEDFSELIENSKLLDEYDCITYTKTVDTVDPILFGSYQAYRLDTLHRDLIELDEEKIKDKIRNSTTRSPEGMLFDLLNKNKKGLVKISSLLKGFGLSHVIANNHTAWCVPYYDKVTEDLCFIVWNMEEQTGDIEVKLLYNDDRVFNFGIVKKGKWYLMHLDKFENSKKLTVILNNKIRNIFDFEKEDRDLFIKSSFRSDKNK
jgi:hypothetical protein